ncbi:hypothetical protein QM334_36060, partial [Burkholderia cenocepacia]
MARRVDREAAVHEPALDEIEFAHDDRIGAEEGESWVFEQEAILYPDGDRVLLSLSPGGADAVV